jgi:hypothetical protein
MISAACSQCGREYQVGEQHAGRTLRCKKCRGLVPVPANAGDAEFADLELDAFDNATGDEDSATLTAPPPRRPKKSRRRGSSSGGMPAIPLSIVAAALVVILTECCAYWT